MFTTNNKKDLVKDISNLSKDEHIEIFKIIRTHTNKYTKNDNGIFINLSILDDNVIDTIKNFVIFCQDNKERLEKKEEIIRSEQDKMFKKSPKENKNEEKEDYNIDMKNIVEDSDDDMEGTKISLKRSKPKYIGIKAKIIKNYKQNSGNIQNIVFF